MDTEEGVEVVWNEVQFSERKNYKLQEVGNGEMMELMGCQNAGVKKELVLRSWLRVCWGQSIYGEEYVGVRAFMGKGRVGRALQDYSDF